MGDGDGGVDKIYCMYMYSARILRPGKATLPSGRT